ncbi:MAG TPA: hypothetical protein VGL98_08560 [Gammaproteobacteria bacterium]
MSVHFERAQRVRARFIGVRFASRFARRITKNGVLARQTRRWHGWCLVPSEID